RHHNAARCPRQSQSVERRRRASKQRSVAGRESERTSTRANTRASNHVAMAKEPDCIDCGNPHPPLVTCSEGWRIFVQDLIRRIGRVDRCPLPCNETIYWI